MDAGAEVGSVSLQTDIEAIDIGINVELERFMASGDVKRLAKVYDRVVVRMGELRLAYPHSARLLDHIGDTFAGAANRLRQESRVVTVRDIETANEEERMVLAKHVAGLNWEAVYDCIR